jgi:predicted nuclease of restriction endonuclease-like RecB superfamily
VLKLTHVQARLQVGGGLATVKQMSLQVAEDLKRASELIALFCTAVEARLTRDTLEKRVVDYAGTRLDYREIDGLAKVISDSFATFSSAFQNSVPAGTADIESSPEPDEEADYRQMLSGYRLAVWREAARAENFPFNNSQLTIALKPGVKSLRRAVSAHDEELLAGLIPSDRRTAILEKVATAQGLSVPEGYSLPELLFADLPGRHRLVALSPDLNPENLLNRYNVELLRGVLYLAPRLKIRVRDRYKDLFKFIKLFGLMHEIKGLGPDNKPATSEKEITGYEILLEGAVSPFLARSDRRYGIRFAQFLPALLLNEGEWQLVAELNVGLTSTALFRLGPQPHLRSHFRGSSEFDSLLEESLALEFEQKFGSGDDNLPKSKQKRGGWKMTREDRVIPVFDTVMIPDFSFEHPDGRRALLEIVGFWEKGYLERKIAKLNRAGRKDFIVLVSERTRCGAEDFRIKGQEPPYQLVFFKGTPRLGPVLEALERCAV